MAKTPNDKLPAKTKKIGEKVLKKIGKKFAAEDRDAAVNAVVEVLHGQSDVKPERTARKIRVRSGSRP